jgi:hypothetical protein
VGEDVVLVAGQLGFQVLQVGDDLLVAPGLAGLALERTDLAFHLADQVGDAQEVLLGLFQLAKGFLLLGLEAGDAGGFLEHQTAVLGLAAEDLGDVALGHDRVTRLAHARPGEQLLDVLQPAGRLVQEVLAAAVAKHPPGDRHFVVSRYRPPRPGVARHRHPQS